MVHQVSGGSRGGGGRGAGAQENRGRAWSGDGRRETGEERVRSGISTRAGSGREIQKGKNSLFITAYHPVKNTNPATFLNMRGNVKSLKKNSFSSSRLPLQKIFFLVICILCNELSSVK